MYDVFFDYDIVPVSLSVIIGKWEWLRANIGLHLLHFNLGILHLDIVLQSQWL